MLIVGEWFTCDDGVARPVVQVRVRDHQGHFLTENFLVDCCADRTVLSAFLLARLNIPHQSPAAGTSLQGIGGASNHVIVVTALELTRDDGGPVQINGTFSAFCDPTATDLSILGRDVLDLFDVIVSRRRNQVLLVAGNHRYQVVL